MAIQLRDYQQRLFNKTHNAMRAGHKRILVVAPTGAGKSFLFAAMVASAAAKGPVLVLIHRDELKKQHVKLFEDLGIMSDNIIIESVFTVARHLEDYPRFCLVIADEAHLSMADSWRKTICHFDTFTIGLSASPLRLDGSSLGDLYSCLVEDEATTVKELIKNKRLAPYEYYSVPNDIDFSDLQLQCGDYKTADLEKKMMDAKLFGNIVSSYERYAKGKQALCFCCSIQHAQAVAEAFSAAGYKSASIDGKMAQNERQRVMEDFRAGRINILTNVGIISEGVSIDGIEAVILARRTASLALWIQMVGRALRYQEGKVAVILDHGCNFRMHGLPDDDRHWTLDAGKKQRTQSEFTPEGTFAIRQCPTCYKVFKAPASVCPWCGAQYPLHAREIKAMEEIELKKIEAENAARDEQERKYRRMEVGRAKTREDLEAIAKERGYKKSWVFVQMKQKGIKR